MQVKAEIPEKLGVLFEPHRYKILYGGRGASKSWGVARALLIKAAEKPLRILCAREVQRTISDSVHRLLSDQIVALGLEGFYQIRETSITGQNGSEFGFAGIRHQDIGKIKSYEGVDICWCEEAQTITKKSWDILIPTIRKEGSEIWITFNPELDTDETYVRFVERPPDGGVVVKIDWRDNPWFPETLRLEKDSLKKRDPEAYDNVWEGKCRSAVEGAIYAREIEAVHADKRLRPVPYDPVLPVHTVWDLGWADAMTVIMAQRASSEVRIIDYIETSHKTYAEIVAELETRKYRWGKDFLPHDSKAKNPQTGKSAYETVQALGRKVQEVPDIGVEEGIRAARQFFSRVYFDETRTARLVHCLKRYRRAINQTTNLPGAPLHDEFSHGADAFRYLAVAIEEMAPDAVIKDPYGAFRRAYG